MVLDDRLTKRELEICGLVAKGLSGEQIAKLLFLSEGTVRNYVSNIYDKIGARNRAQMTAIYMAEFAQAETEMPDPRNDANLLSAQDCPRLRLEGLQSLPDLIPVAIAGKAFVIGRFDVGVGLKQCDFEFGKATKAVSRRHAAIERTPHGYAIVDLGSRAGTFVNGAKLTPGEQRPLQTGDHVSFGGAGADYVFEC